MVQQNHLINYYKAVISFLCKHSEHGHCTSLTKTNLLLYLRDGTLSINICLTAQNVFLQCILLKLWRWIQSIRRWYSLFSCCWLCYVLQPGVVAIMSVCTAVHKTQKQERFVLKNCIFSLIYVFKFFKLSYCLETKWTRSGYKENELHCFVNKEGE